MTYVPGDADGPLLTPVAQRPKAKEEVPIAHVVRKYHKAPCSAPYIEDDTDFLFCLASHTHPVYLLDNQVKHLIKHVGAMIRMAPEGTKAGGAADASAGKEAETEALYSDNEEVDPAQQALLAGFQPVETPQKPDPVKLKKLLEGAADGDDDYEPPPDDGKPWHDSEE